MNTSFEYRINKKHGRPVFDLKDMLAVVEAVECEALASELSSNVVPSQSDPVSMPKVKVVRSAPILPPQSCAAAANQLPRISDSLKKRWSQSLSESRRVPSRENPKVYPRIIKELDELYEARTRKLEKRITQVREEYDREAQKRAQERLERQRRHQEEYAKQEQERIAKEQLQKQQEEEEERQRAEQQAKVKTPTPPSQLPQPTLQAAPVPHTEEVKPVAVEEKKTIPTQPPSGNDARMDVFLKPDIVNAVIDQVKQSCQALLKPSTAPDKEIAMKIKRAVAVPGIVILAIS